MQIINCEQGSPEWHAARSGVITASMFSTIRKKVGMPTEQQQKFIDARLAGGTLQAALDASGYKREPTADVVCRALAGEPVGEWSEAAKDYAFRLAVERIAGGTIEGAGYENSYMRRGRELEEACRVRHEQDINDLVELAGLVTTDCGSFGCSADSLVGLDGGGEYKCFVAPDRLRSIVLDNDWGEVMDQVQGCMWICEREWWDMCLYCPALDPVGKGFIRERVMRDSAYIDGLMEDVEAFNEMVVTNVAALSGPSPAAGGDVEFTGEINF